MSAEPLAAVIDVDFEARRRILQPDPPAEASAPKHLDELVIQEDAFGKFAMVDGVRIPVRNGGLLPGVDPLTDWQTAREVEQSIRSGEAIDARPLSWRNISGACLKVSTSTLTGWTTYTVLGEPGALLWAASSVLVGVPVALWALSTLNLGVVLLCTLGYAAWTWVCLQFTEKDPARASR